MVKIKIEEKKTYLTMALGICIALTVGSQPSFAGDTQSKDSEQPTKTKIIKKVTKTVTTDGDNTKTVIKEEKSKVSFKVPISCLSPHAACEESQKVIDTLMKISKAYSHGNFDEFAKYCDDEITIFDKRKKKLIVGKKAVVANVKKRWKNAHQGPNPVLSYTIEHPYAKVTGDTAVVTFKAIKVIGGTKKPGKYVSKSTDIFIKKDGIWKKLHYVSNWKKVKS